MAVATSRRRVAAVSVTADTLLGLTAAVGRGNALNTVLRTQADALLATVKRVRVAIYSTFVITLAVIGAVLAYAYDGHPEIYGYTVTAKRAAMGVSATALALSVLQLVLYRVTHVREKQAEAERLLVSADTALTYVDTMNEAIAAAAKGQGSAAEARRAMESSNVMFDVLEAGASGREAVTSASRASSLMAMLMPRCGVGAEEAALRGVKAEFELVSKTLLPPPPAPGAANGAPGAPGAANGSGMDASLQNSLKLMFVEYSDASARLLSLAALRMRFAKAMEVIMLVCTVVTVITGIYQFTLFLKIDAAETLRDEISAIATSLPASTSSTWVLFCSTLSRFFLHVMVDAMRVSQAVQRYLGRSQLLHGVLEQVVGLLRSGGAAAGVGGPVSGAVVDQFSTLMARARELLPIIRDAVTTRAAAVVMEAPASASVMLSSVATSTTGAAAATAVAAAAAAVSGTGATAPVAPPAVTAAAVAAVASVPFLLRLSANGCGSRGCRCCNRSQGSDAPTSAAAAANAVGSTSDGDTAATIASAAVMTEVAAEAMADIDAATAGSTGSSATPAITTNKQYLSVMTQLFLRLRNARAGRAVPTGNAV